MRKNSSSKVVVGSLALALALLPSRKSYASSSTVPILLSTLLETVEQSLHLGEIVDTSIKVVKILNEVAAATRTLVRLGNEIANYSPEAFLNDAMAGLEMAYPEARGLRQEVDELIQNGQSLEDGTFYRRYSHHDGRTDRATRMYAKALTQGALATVLGAKRNTSDRKLSPVQQKILERFERTGAAAKILYEQSALGGFAQEVKALREATLSAAREGEGSIKDQLLAEIMVADFSQAENQTRMLQLEEQDAAEREAARQENEAALKRLNGRLYRTKSPMRPRWGHFPEE